MGAGRLVFDGDIELIDATPTDEGYWFEAVAGIEFGQPVPVTVILTSLLRDGALVAKTGDDNREVAIPFRVHGSDLLALALGEKRLGLAIGKRTTLEWTPPDGIGPTTVFDVMTSHLDNPPHDDLAELRNRRTYTLRLTCLPFGRSASKIIDAGASLPTSGGSVAASFDATTGWATWADPTYYTSFVSFAADTSVKVEGTASVKSQTAIWTEGYINSSGFHPSWGFSEDLVAGLSIATGTGGYLSVSIRILHEDVIGGFAKPGLNNLWMSTSGGGESEVTSFTAVSRSDNGFVRYTWPVAAGQTITGLRFKVAQSRNAEAIPRPFTWYDALYYQEGATGGNQIVKTLEVQGSARTTGSLHISAANDSTALKHVLAITAPTNELPAGFQPDGRRWVVNGTTTPDLTALGGSYFSPDATYPTTSITSTMPVFSVPVSMLTAGPYTIVALVKAESSSPNFGIQAQVQVGGTLVGPTSEAEVTAAGLGTGWQFLTVGTVYLPPLPMRWTDGTARVRLVFKGAKFADVYMIPAWQVNGRSVADFSIVVCGSGTPAPGGASSHLWIDSPDVAQPQGGWWRGPTGDRANSQSAWPDAKKPGIHVFEPGELSAFLVSTGAQGPTMALEYYPAWGTNAAL